jgi:hypothetical protein
MALGATATPYVDRTDEVVAGGFMSDFLAVFPEAAGKVAFSHIERWSWGVTRPRFGYQRQVRALLKAVENIHFAGDWVSFVSDDEIGGFGHRGRSGEYCIMMCLHAAMRSGVRAAREILEETR